MSLLQDLLVRLGLDSKGFTSGMEKAGQEAKNFSDKAENTETSAKSLGLQFTELNSILNMVQRGIAMAGQAYDATVGTFIDYAAQVRDMSRATGMSVEETSRLIQVADDVNISYEKLKMSMQLAAKQGIDTSTESLKRLSDQYMSLAPGTERMQFLLTTFGRSGADMGKLMELGSKGIDKVNASVEKGLILTPEILRQARAHEILNDMLADQIQAQKVLSGMTATEIINSAEMTYLIKMRASALYDAAIATGELSNREVYALGKAGEFTKQAREQIQAEIDLKTGLAEATTEIEKQMSAQELLAQQISEVNFGIAGTATQIMDDYRENLQDLEVEEGNLRDALHLALSQGWSPTSEKVQDLTQNLSDNADAQLTLEDNMRRATTEMIYQKVAAGLDADAALALALGLGLLDQPTYDLGVALDDLTQQYLDGKIGLEDYETAVINARNTVIESDGTAAAMEVNTYLNTIETITRVYSQGIAVGGYAKGGSFTVPGSGSGDRPYTIGLTPGEHVSVTPKGESGLKEIDYERLAIIVRDAVLQVVQ